MIPNLNDQAQVEKLKQEIIEERIRNQAAHASTQESSEAAAARKQKQEISEQVSQLLSAMEEASDAEGADVDPRDVDMDGPAMDYSHILDLSRTVLLEKSMYKPLESRPVFWHGVGESAVLPPLPNRKKRITELDWRTFLNLTQPHLWYPLARVLNRRIIVHCGPTNSGKTYSAMKRLAEADSGKITICILNGNNSVHHSSQSQ